MASQTSLRTKYAQLVNKRYGHKTVIIGTELYVWGGWYSKLPSIHESGEKRSFTSRVDVLHLDTGAWESKWTAGDPHQGVVGYACTTLSHNKHIVFFGGYCGHDNCYHNSITQIDIESLTWSAVSISSSSGPIAKDHCGMTSFASEGQEYLFVVGGIGPPPDYSLQSNAQYSSKNVSRNIVRTNEQHIFSFKTGKWLVPSAVGQAPPPYSHFSYNRLTSNSIILYGGLTCTGSTSDIYIVTLVSSLTVQWQKLVRSLFSQWPVARYGHGSALFDNVSPSLLVVGGLGSSRDLVSDGWIMDINKRTWKKLELPESVSKRSYHSLSSFSITPHCVWGVVFSGYGHTSLLGDTKIIKLLYSDNKWRDDKVLNINSLPSPTASLRSLEGRRDSSSEQSSMSHSSSLQDDAEQIKMEWNQSLSLSDQHDDPADHDDSGGTDEETSERCVEGLSRQLEELTLANRQLLTAQEATELEKRRLQTRLQDCQSTIDALQHEMCQLRAHSDTLERQLRQCRGEREDAESVLKETIASCQNTIKISQQYFTTERETVN